MPTACLPTSPSPKSNHKSLKLTNMTSTFAQHYQSPDLLQLQFRFGPILPPLQAAVEVEDLHVPPITPLHYYTIAVAPSTVFNKQVLLAYNLSFHTNSTSLSMVLVVLLLLMSSNSTLMMMVYKPESPMSPLAAINPSLLRSRLGATSHHTTPTSTLHQMPNL